LWNEFSDIFVFNNVEFSIYENPCQSIKQLNKYYYLEHKYKNFLINNNGTIPKIIHQIAPSDKSKWHPLWFECQKTWLINYPDSEYEYKLWNDEDDLENLIKNNFPFFFKDFKSYPFKIQRIDIARYFILLKYGGIYADMDFYCYNNFYEFLDKQRSNIALSPWTNVEILQNSLMASNLNNNYIFVNIIDEAVRRKKYNLSHDHMSFISQTTGPKLVSDVYDILKSFLNPLEMKLYNPIGCKSQDDENLYNKNTCYCKHFGTGKW